MTEQPGAHGASRPTVRYMRSSFFAGKLYHWFEVNGVLELHTEGLRENP